MELYHYGMPRRSGRYPYGSGENPYQSLRKRIATVWTPASGVQLEEKEGVLPKGTLVERVSTKAEREHGDPDKRKYVSVTPDDKALYRETWEYFISGKDYLDAEIHTYELKKDVRVAEGKQILKHIIDKYGDKELSEYMDLNLASNEESGIQMLATAYVHKAKSKTEKKQAKEIANSYYSKKQIKEESKHYYQRYKEKGFTDEEMKLALDLAAKRKQIERSVENMMFKDKAISDSIVKEYRDKGYDAMVDVEDWFTQYSQYPVILLNPKESAKLIKYERLIDDD